MFKTIALRALRGFVAGGLAQIVAVFAANSFSVKSVTDLQNLFWVLLVAFLTGGFLALDKLSRYETPQG